MRRRDRTRPKAYSLSCTDTDWGRVRVLAERKGLSISRYMVERGLTVDPETESEPPPRLVLDEAEQRTLLDRVAAIAERTLEAGDGRGGDDEDSQLSRLPGRGDDANHDAHGPRGGAAGDADGPLRGAACGGNRRPAPRALTNVGGSDSP